MMNIKLKQFLDESNKIEGVFDKDSLKQALYAWICLKWQERMSCSVILATHKILMKNHDLQSDEKGYFRKCQVWVGNKEMIPFSKIKEQMEIWCDNVNSKPQHWKESHIAFEEIHPFVDGNGRIGRLLMLWQRTKCGLPIKVIWAKDRLEYYKWFRS